MNPLICICSNVTELEIIDEIRAGATCVPAIQEGTRAGVTCRDCIPDLQELLDDHLPDNAHPLLPPTRP